MKFLEIKHNFEISASLQGGTICLVSQKNEDDSIRAEEGAEFQRNLELVEFQAEF